MNDKERKEKIDAIIQDVRVNMSNYEDFVLDCVLACVETWTSKELIRWAIPE